ncbi:MAG: restriction endonuclease subunit S [Thermoanaerobacteraceae bacterium]|jgi:type I restriction enzyme S subunit|nr:restriction endonuclease subunit S [Thermoanaerobacteraceae bacterium]
MRLNKLGNYIELLDLRNKDNALGKDAVVGISTQKEFIPTKADLEGVNLASYKIVPPHCFAFVADTSRRGDKMSLAYNKTNKNLLVSSISTIFRVSNTEELLSDYLYMYFNRPEFDRYARFNSWGSARETFSWDDMCDIEIDLPSIETQQKYVDIYKSMQENQKVYEKGLEDLNKLIVISLEQFKHKCKRVAVGKLLEDVDIRNSDGKISNVQGINIEKTFIPSVANLSSTDLTKYKIIQKNQFAYSAMQTGRDECIRIALFHEEEPAIISPAYSVLQTKTDDVLAEYIMLWFSRSESDRYGWFISDSSIRASLELSRFYEIEIPLPSLEEQEAVVSFYNSIYLIKSNISKLSDLSKNICPILIKGSLEEAAKT